MKKKWWKSKTLWVNALALIAGGVQAGTGFVVSMELQAAALALANLVLRAVTNAPLEA